MRIVTELTTGVTVNKNSKKQNHFQPNSKLNADELSSWRLKKISVKGELSN